MTTTTPPAHVHEPKPISVRIAAVQYLLRPIHDWSGFENQVRFVMKAAGDYKPQFVLLPEIFTTQLLSFMDTTDLYQAVRNMNDYTARYTAGETRFLCPAEISDADARACADLALSVHGKLGLRDLSRTDIIIGAQGPTFIETNVSPGMTETSLVPLSVEAAGLNFGELCVALVRQAHRRGASAHGR